MNAQESFDRGLTLAYSFAHRAAEEEFRQALASDPECAMAYWGIALVRGPHINRSKVSGENATAAWEAISQAQKLAPQTSLLEKELIQAASRRYASPQPDDRSPLDAAYAAAMREVWRKHPENAEVATLFAESAMDVHPWNFWKDGAPQPWTLEIVEALESALKTREPKNPGANHLYPYSRSMEASPTPEKALAAATRLPLLVPDSGHMQHMPGHIYVRLGLWREAARVNRVALNRDERYHAVYPLAGGLYERYMSHNKRFCTYLAMMLGRQEEALDCAHRLIDEIPAAYLDKDPDDMDPEMAVVAEALMRFGRWNEILEQPEPRQKQVLARTLWHFTRAVALTALGRAQEATGERASFLKAASALPAKAQMGVNPAKQFFAMAALLLEGEMAAKQKDFKTSIAKLKKAVEAEDNLLLNEPPDWMQPVRHTLGAVLLRAGRAAEAEQVYREDLKRNPENGWGLMGLRDSLQRLGKFEETDSTAVRLAAAWQEADVKPRATCYCQDEG